MHTSLGLGKLTGNHLGINDTQNASNTSESKLLSGVHSQA